MCYSPSSENNHFCSLRCHLMLISKSKNNYCSTVSFKQPPPRHPHTHRRTRTIKNSALRDPIGLSFINAALYHQNTRWHSSINVAVWPMTANSNARHPPAISKHNILIILISEARALQWSCQKGCFPLELHYCHVIYWNTLCGGEGVIM